VQIEGAKAELRSRPPYEAADLGVLLLRSLWRPTLAAWLACVLPLQLCVLLTFDSVHPAWSYLALWWLKPVYARAYGLVVGRGLFGDAPGVRALYRGLWTDGKRGLLGDLLWRRLDPARTLVAPVALLEGLTGGAAARRRRTLGEGSTSTVGLVLAACVAMELAIMLGLIIAGQMLVPEEAGWIAEDLWSLGAQSVSRYTMLASYMLAIAMVEPLFVASGFGLYINRRTNIEGWDVELTFRRMARRLAGAVVLALLSGALLTAVVTPASAQPGSPASAAAPLSQSAVDDGLRLPVPELASDGKAEAAMKRVLGRPELQRSRVEEHWELRSSPKSEPDRKLSMPWLSWLAGAFARLFVVLLWLLGGAALVVVIYLLVQRTQRMFPSEAGRESLPEFLAHVRNAEGRETPLSLREVVPRALALLAEGKHVAALSVLYVGTLTALMRQDGLHVPRQATEGQCLAAVRAAPIAEARRDLFGELTLLWQLSAYAHTPPDDARLRAICQRFSAEFCSRVEPRASAFAGAT
jgi:hypothetical protein